MELIKNLEEIEKPYRNAVVTIGNFDGVHKGHMALINTVIDKSRELGGTSVAMTFDPHPLRVLTQNNNPPLITLNEQKTELFEKTGIDVLVCLPFTKEFAEISARSFIQDILVGKLGMKAAVVGHDYAFGKNREGDLKMLKRLADEFGFKVIVPDWVKITSLENDRVSSTRIREIVQNDGNVEEAENLLGRHYQIRGEVVSGRNRGGKLLGFPTANIHLHDELCPKMGVYAVNVECSRGKFNGVANLGYSPTFGDHMFTVEVHLLDFSDNIYGEKIKVNFVSRLREEKKFSGIEELSNQIKKDVEKARCIFEKQGQ